MSIGKNIRRIRLQRGITQEELGYLIGNDGAMVRKYENGTRTPKKDKLQKIADALGVNVEVLLNADFDNIAAMHRLFQIFRQYDGSFTKDGKLTFKRLNIRPWFKQWERYTRELEAAKAIPDAAEREAAIEEITDHFNWWMDIYPKSDTFKQEDSEKQIAIRQKLKKERKNTTAKKEHT